MSYSWKSVKAGGDRLRRHLRAVARGPGQADAIPEWRRIDRGITSFLVKVEALRTLDRLRLRARLADAELACRRAIILQMLDSLELVEVDSLILERAAKQIL